MVLKQLLSLTGEKKKQTKKQNNQPAPQPECNSWSLNVLLIQEFSSGGMSAATEGEDQQNESSFLRYISNPSPKLHTILLEKF